MKIQTIHTQHRRDFTATYVCDHCEKTQDGDGYDDAHFHRNVIPAMQCKSCGKTAGDTYRPLTTKYAADVVI